MIPLSILSKNSSCKMVILDLEHHIDLNAPFCSNWARLPKTTNQLVIRKHVYFLEQSTTLENTLEKIQININTQVWKPSMFSTWDNFWRLYQTSSNIFINQLKLLTGVIWIGFAWTNMCNSCHWPSYGSHPSSSGQELYKWCIFSWWLQMG